MSIILAIRKDSFFTSGNAWQQFSLLPGSIRERETERKREREWRWLRAGPIVNFEQFKRKIAEGT